MDKETIYTVELSYSQIDTILNALFDKDDTHSMEVWDTLHAQRNVDHVKPTQTSDIDNHGRATARR